MFAVLKSFVLNRQEERVLKADFMLHLNWIEISCLPTAHMWLQVRHSYFQCLELCLFFMLDPLTILWSMLRDSRLCYSKDVHLSSQFRIA
jgi:hypothetical protein